MATRTYRFGTHLADPQGGSGPDLAVLMLSSGFLVGGSRTGFSRAIGVAAPGDRVMRFGRGFNTPQEAWTELGPMRWGRQPVDSVDDDFVITTRDPDYYWTSSGGDSGGPIFLDDVLVGIASKGTVTSQCLPPHSPGVCRDYDVRIDGDVFWAIQVVQEPWFTWDVNVFDIHGVEIRANNEVEYDLDTAPWAELARISHEMCTNRSDLLAGRYTGHQTHGKYGVACSSGRGIAVGVVGIRERHRSEWSFERLDEVGWARAMRLAQEACVNRDFVGGWFTGDEDPTRSLTLVCSTNAQHFDVTRAELSAWPVDDLDTNTGFAQSLRSAHRFCELQGYETGFMTGHQTGERYGVVCQAKF